MAGHIKLERKIINWEWYQDANVCRLFIHLLLLANHKEGKWQGHIIRRGELITGLEKLSINTGLSIMQIRTCFKKLKSTNEITIKVTNKFRLVTICKYDTYQSLPSKSNKQNNKQTNKPVTSQQQTNNKQVTANKNIEVLYTSIKEEMEEAESEKEKPIGIVLVKKIANEVWKDKIWMEQLCMGNGLKTEQAKDWMLQFNLSISQDIIAQFDKSKYKKMFAGWLRMKLGGGQKIVKMSDEKADEKKFMKSIGL